MVVEFIGATGAGKTALARFVQRAAQGERPMVVASDLVMDHPGLRAVTNPSAANVVQDVAGLPYVVRSWPRRREFLAFCAGVILSHGPSFLEKAASMRSVLRRLGLHERASRHAAGVTVLLDEGVVLSAYHLFGYGKTDFEQSELEEFARLVPLPDVVVYVRAPLVDLVARSRTRSDPRRQLAGKADSIVERNLTTAIDMFDRLVATEPLRGRVITVENGDGAPATATVELLTRALEAVAPPPGGTGATRRDG